MKTYAQTLILVMMLAVLIVFAAPFFTGKFITPADSSCVLTCDNIACIDTFSTAYPGDTICLTGNISDGPDPSLPFINFTSMTLDCQGYYLISNGSYATGVQITGNNSKILNCNFMNFTDAAYSGAVRFEATAFNGLVENMTSTGTRAQGVSVTSVSHEAHNTVLKNIQIDDAANGAFYISAANTTFYNSHLTSSSTSIKPINPANTNIEWVIEAGQTGYLSSGNFTFSNITVYGNATIDGAIVNLNCTADSNCGIIVHEGGNLIVQNSAVITATDIAANPYFEVYGNLQFTDSELSYFQEGPNLYSSNNLITNSHLHHSDNYGVQCFAPLNTITYNTMDEQGYGVAMREQGDNSTVSYNNITVGYYGVEINTDSNTISYNNVTGALSPTGILGTGILLNDSHYNDIFENIVYDNFRGFQMTGSENDIHNNYVYLNRREGIYLSGNSQNNELTYNTIYNNSQAGNYPGLYIASSGGYSPFNNTIAHNEIYAHDYSLSSCAGIKLMNDSDTVVYNNSIHENGIGLYLDGYSQGTKVYKNDFLDNEYGVYVASDNNYGYHIYHNNFDNVNNVDLVAIPDGSYWHVGYPLGGNYYADLTCDDNSSSTDNVDGLCSENYTVAGYDLEYAYVDAYGWDADAKSIILKENTTFTSMDFEGITGINELYFGTGNNYAIYIESPSDAVTLDCKGLIIDEWDLTYNAAAMIRVNASEFTIKNCDLRGGYWGTINGIRIVSNITGGQILNNTISAITCYGFKCQTSGIYGEVNLQNLVIDQNTFSEIFPSNAQGGGYGVYFNSSSTATSINITNNTFSIDYARSGGIYINGNSFMDSNIFEGNMAGAILVGRGTHTITNNNISSMNNYGIDSLGNKGPESMWMENNTITNIGDVCLWFSSSLSNETVTSRNNVLSECGSYDFYIQTNNGTLLIDSTNDTFDNSKTAIGSTTGGFARLNVTKYLDIQVSNSIGTPLDGVDVAITDAQSRQISETTDSDGRILAWQVPSFMLEATILGDLVTTTYSPLSLSITATGYTSLSDSVDVLASGKSLSYVLTVPTEEPSGATGGNAATSFAPFSVKATDSGERIDIAYITAGQTYSGSNDWNLDLKLYKIIFAKSISKASVDFKETGTAPAIENSYKYFEITKTGFGDSDISTVTFAFRVPKTWMSQNSVTSKDLGLYRYENSWNQIASTPTGEDTEYYYFQAATNKMSYYTIAGAQGTSFWDVITAIGNYYTGQLNFLNLLNVISQYYG